MIIKWFGQSCFELDTGINRVVFDPYSPMAGFPSLSLKAGRLYISHQHGDHNNASAVELIPWDPEDKICTIRRIASFHDENGGKDRGENIIHIFGYDDRIRIAHLGDLGHRLYGESLDALKGVDVLMIPVGGFFTIDGATAAQIVRDVAPRCVIPMHYNLGSVGVPVLTSVEPFVEAIRGDYPVYACSSDTLVYREDTPRGVYVLKYCL